MCQSVVWVKGVGALSSHDNLLSASRHVRTELTFDSQPSLSLDVSSRQ